MSLTPWLTGAGARSAEGTNSGHKNAEGMPAVGVRVEPPVRLGRVGTVVQVHLARDEVEDEYGGVTFGWVSSVQVFRISSCRQCLCVCVP